MVFAPFWKRSLLLKERIWSPGDQILSFQSTPLFWKELVYRKANRKPQKLSFLSKMAENLSSVSSHLKKSEYLGHHENTPFIFNPLKPHFYIVNKHYFAYYAKNIDCGYSLEPPRWGGSNEYPQSVFSEEIWKVPEFFLSENFPFLVVQFSIYSNRRVFVMGDLATTLLTERGPVTVSSQIHFCCWQSMWLCDEMNKSEINKTFSFILCYSLYNYLTSYFFWWTSVLQATSLYSQIHVFFFSFCCSNSTQYYQFYWLLKMVLRATALFN